LTLSALNARLDSMVPEFRARLASRLALIEDEARTLRAAIAALDGNGSRLPAQHPREPVANRVRRALRESPGSRASMIALETAIPQDRVNRTLARFEKDGQAVRQGLGWCLVLDDSNGKRRARPHQRPVRSTRVVHD
jgi:hypothetical protein